MTSSRDRIDPRLLPDHLLELLEPETRARVEETLAADPEGRRSLTELRELAREWSSEEEHPPETQLTELLAGRASDAERRPMLEHLLACRDCRFSAALILAEQAEETEPRSRVPESPPRAARVVPVMAAMAAVAALALITTIGWFGFWLAGQRSTAGTAVVSTDFASVRLDTSRGGGAEAIVLRLSELTTGVSLEVQTRLPGDRADWSLLAWRGGQDDTVMRGSTALDADGPVLRSLRIIVPRDVLKAFGYTLVVRSADGSIERRWKFSVRP